MTHTDQFGREYERIEDFAPAKIVKQVTLCETDTGRYLGLLTQWEGIGWTYPGHRFGERALPTCGAAWAMFMRRAGVTCSLKLDNAA